MRTGLQVYTKMQTMLLSTSIHRGIHTSLGTVYALAGIRQYTQVLYKLYSIYRYILQYTQVYTSTYIYIYDSAIHRYMPIYALVYANI